jgi:hypothetical protein
MTARNNARWPTFEARELTLLAPGQASVRAESLGQPVTLHYPYDWTWRGQGNVLDARPRLVMPGVKAGGVYYVADTRELWSLRVEPAGSGRLRALLLTHRSVNDGADRAAASVRMHAGQQEQFDVLTAGSLGEINRARFGVCAAMRGRMVQIPVRGWTAQVLKEADYARAAGAFRDVFDYVVVREVEPHAWIPPLFQRRGMRVIHYQYLGALRRGSSQVTDALEAEIGLKDAKGQRYTAPRAPDGAWLLCDIRRDDVRARFVNQAQAAVRAGYDGIFLDGYPFWSDATGACGGNVPGATRSLAWARWKLLREMRAALRAARPGAVLGVLGNQYFDALCEADFVMKERMYCEWAKATSDAAPLRTIVSQDMDIAFETDQAPYVFRNLGYGVKGVSPIAVQSSLHFIRRPREIIYFDSSDFRPNQLDDWLKTVTAIATQGDLYIKSIEPPTAAITFEDVDTICADAQCSVKFSRPVSIASESAENTPAVRECLLEPGKLYRLCRP